MRKRIIAKIIDFATSQNTENVPFKHFRNGNLAKLKKHGFPIEATLPELQAFLEDQNDETLLDMLLLLYLYV